jgi:hypothetical protein
MAMRNVQLTPAQERLMLVLGGPAPDAVIDADVLEELVKLGLVYHREDGPMDFTDEGEEVYESLTRNR